MASGPALITSQHLIDRLDGGAEELRRLAGDDGTGTYDADKVATAIATASEDAYGALLAGFATVERVQALVENDPAVIDAICLRARYALTRWKNSFIAADGRHVFQSSAREALDLLRDKARGAKRSSAEESTGVGQSSVLRPRSAAGRDPSPVRDGTGTWRGF